MGAAYVVEDSALDGAALARAVARTLGDDTPRRYLALRGKNTRRHWSDFALTIESWGARAPAHARVMACDSARATFAAFASAFAAAGALAT
jgi:heme oxygenase